MSQMRLQDWSLKMKLVKSLLLGSAAGLVAVAGAQAADLPVKAKPVEYVKICSLYGVGFYYIPGTDMCLKIGGWVRAEYAYGDNGNMTWGPFNANFNDRTTSNSTWRARGYITADARNQTEYGTVRGYLAVGLSTSNIGTDSASNTFSANRAFIQWAGFTFGLAQSFYDFYSVPATSYWGSFPASDTGDPGWMVLGYTAQFGNGLSATLAAEMRRMTAIDNVGGILISIPNAFGSGQTGSGSYGGFQAPDVVANLRVDQAWGSAQIMGALHEVDPLYYSALSPIAHPNDELGFAVGAGIKLNAPMIGQGDFLQAQVNYTQGALKYIFQTPTSNWFKQDGSQFGFGALSDGAYGGSVVNTTDVELTTAWGINAAYEHFWNPRWRTSLYGGYAAVNYDDRANNMMCSVLGTANGNGLAGSLAVAKPGCNMDWSTWWIGSRTQWNVTKDFYMGVDVLYSKLQTADINGASTGLTSSVPVGQSTADVDNWMFRFRVHRDFYP
jgi:Porin subfamily